MLGPIFLTKKLKISAVYTELKSKTPLCFEKKYGVPLLFLPTIMTIE